MRWRKVRPKYTPIIVNRSRHTKRNFSIIQKYNLGHLYVREIVKDIN